MEDGFAPTNCRQVDVVVYVRERGTGACAASVGFEATIEVYPGDGIGSVTLRPMREPAMDHVVRPQSAIWRAAEAFLMVLPALRQRAALRQPRKVA